jgi:hypothetical protein
MNARWLRWTISGVLLLAWMVGAVGCASSHKAKWDPRVGGYTYDEAVKEFGPPDKKETTGDGTLVTEWTLQRSQVYSTPSAGMGWGWRGRWGWAAGYDVNTTPELVLQLHFGPDGRLQTWKRVYK